MDQLTGLCLDHIGQSEPPLTVVGDQAIGYGTFGLVFRCLDSSLHDVAVKVMPETMFDFCTFGNEVKNYFAIR